MTGCKNCDGCGCKTAVKKQKVLVTGAAGFVGSKMLAEMQNKGYTDIRATDLFTPRNLPAGIEFIKSDVTDRKSLDEAVKDCSAIIHVADLFDFFASWEKLYAVNVKGTRNICEAAIDNGVKRIVRFSSGSIYGVGNNLDEYSLVDPIDPYAESKVLGEIEASNLNGFKGFHVTLLRPAVIFGEGARYSAARIFMTQALTAKLLGTKLLPGAGTFKGPYVHVDDVVGAALHIYENDLFTKSRNPADMAFNINADDAVSPKDIAEMAEVNIKKTGLAKMLQGHMPDIHVTKGIMGPVADVCSYAVKHLLKAGILKKKPGAMLEPGEVDFMFIPGDLTMNNEKLKATGFSPKYTCQSAMPDVMRWYDNQGWEKLLF
ncbi:MAG: NAD(P)-dependent oxidoreductase [Candidatus Nanoarchaeia archaeon]|nr:NAD(P)-dependent oxidoreductase [Candidatus Nanoarchaeia archaeon]